MERHGTRDALGVDTHDAGRVTLAESQRRDPRVKVHMQVVALVARAGQERVDICDRCAVPAAVVRVVRDVEEASGALEAAAECDLRIDVLDDRCSSHGRAGSEPVAHDMVAVVLSDGLVVRLESQ